MRTTADRIRHTLLFELIAMLLVALAITLILQQPLHRTGGLALLFSLSAMIWNYVYNVGFDYWRSHAGESSPNQRSTTIRVVHALGFETSFVLITLPMAAWWLSISLWEALLLDAGIALFFVVYAFIYNACYDRFFPIPVAADKP